MNFTDLPDLPTIWKAYIERYKILNVQGDDFSKMGIFARNTIGLLSVFRATTNNTGENGDKKQNTRRYTLKFKVSDVCWIGGPKQYVSEPTDEESHSAKGTVFVPSL